MSNPSSSYLKWPARRPTHLPLSRHKFHDTVAKKLIEKTAEGSTGVSMRVPSEHMLRLALHQQMFTTMLSMLPTVLSVLIAVLSTLGVLHIGPLLQVSFQQVVVLKTRRS
jgi:hypothetical protein